MSGGLDKTGPDYEEERSRLKERRQHNKTLDAALNPRDRLHRLVFPADVQQTVLIKEEAPEEWRSNVDQKDPETLNIKEEEELRTSLDVEQLSVKEETDDTRFSFTAVPLKNFPADVQQMISVVAEGSEEWRSDVDQKDPESLHMKCHQHQVEDEDLPTNSSADQMNVATVGEDCGGAETTRNPDLNTNEDDSSSSETEVSEDDDEDVNSADFLLKDSSDSGSDEKIQSRQKSFSCDDCGKRFNRRDHLNIHMIIHTGQKPFACDVCKQSFGHKSHLNRHTRIHTGQKPFACDVCGQMFRDKSHLNAHMRIHTGQKPFVCDVCGQQFGQKSTLNNHIRIHTGQKPFACDVCGQQFRDKSTLNKHMIIHTGQKPFACDVCGQRFGRKSSLNAHMRIHTGQKPFACDVCGQRFGRRSHLKTHMRIHTGQNNEVINIKTVSKNTSKFTQS
ncbi:zinc finger protein 660-like [Nematolebias whitei]|uniref:zinc finger protein 660-like n=1 Tax=Nematolebias whitei TaxID=451745 RepID=UPI00189ABE3C|nr:zinc finger protein 660-like [Nematolebias whitei]